MDLARLLADWPYEPGRINARIVQDVDGVRRIQVRIELGVLQMEIEGRPDGRRPDGFESVLHRVHADMDRYENLNGTRGGFLLGEPACAALREEAVQYYHRYVALFALEEFEGVVRDTSRNLAVFDLCRDFAATAHDREILEQFRPHVILMRVRALAALALPRSSRWGAPRRSRGATRRSCCAACATCSSRSCPRASGTNWSSA